MISKICVMISTLSLCGIPAFATPQTAKIISTDMTMQGEPGERGKLLRVIDGDSVVMSDGDQGEIKISLANIQAPKMAWPEKGYQAWPLADAAKAYLQTLVEGEVLQLYYLGDQRDRYGRAVAQVRVAETGVWIQEEMVRAGYARVYSWASHPVDMSRLLQVEAMARTAKRGIWNDAKTDGFYAVLSPDPNPLAQYVDSLQIVEGIVLSAANVRGTIYLNFGSDYKTDFTIAISKKNAKRFAKQGFEPLCLEGARVRVRGWIELKNGPIIWLSDLQRLEVLD